MTKKAQKCALDPLFAGVVGVKCPGRQEADEEFRPGRSPGSRKESGNRTGITVSRMGAGIGMVNWSKGVDSDKDSGNGFAQLQEVTTDSQNSSGR